MYCSSKLSGIVNHTLHIVPTFRIHHWHQRGSLFWGENCTFLLKSVDFWKLLIFHYFSNGLLPYLGSCLRMWTPLCIHHWHQRGSLFWGENCTFLLKSVDFWKHVVLSLSSNGLLTYVNTFVYTPLTSMRLIVFGWKLHFFAKKCSFLETSYISLFLQWITSIFRLLLTYVNPFVYVVHTQKNPSIMPIGVSCYILDIFLRW